MKNIREEKIKYSRSLIGLLYLTGILFTQDPPGNFNADMVDHQSIQLNWDEPENNYTITAFISYIEDDGSGAGVVNTDIKGFVSRDSGSTFIEGELVDEGDWDGTTKRILAFHDLPFTGASGTAMCYKITTHNASLVNDTKIHATSFGWK